MNRSEFWKNFSLGEELAISGTFIHNGLNRFYEMHQLDYAEEIFEVFYNLSIGIERLFKITVVLLEHSEESDQEKLEESLKTHNHCELLQRVQSHHDIKLGKPHNEILKLLANFYKTHRYERFCISSITGRHKERDALISYFAEYIDVEIPQPDSLIATSNDARNKNSFGKSSKQSAANCMK